MSTTPRAATVPPLRVRTPDGQERRFQRAFYIGREHDCDVCIGDAHVSRKHVLVSFRNGHWSFEDQRSASGVFVDGHPVRAGRVDGSLNLGLGEDGPFITLETAPSPQPPAEPTRPARKTELVRYVERYFGASTDQQVGRRTMMIREAFRDLQRKQRRRFGLILLVAALCAAGALAYAYYVHARLRQMEASAEELFYRMKQLDVSIANLERLVAESGSGQVKEQVRQFRTQRRAMDEQYERYLEELDLYGGKLTEQQRLILRVTRLFGECELAAPPDYVEEVSRYIGLWQSTPRFARGVTLARDMGYPRVIAEEFLEQNLPPQFFYLALQESDFNEYASGPPTRYGIAKGMWQFIPETGTRYGLKTGPFANQARPDPDDDRHDWQKATRAAAQYIKFIYATDAQASGLLVMASYNWGENSVIHLIRKMPENPRDRNFWKLLEQYRQRVPKQTYDYVLKIVAAAVIGENPRLFGFEIENPLRFLDEP
jgi:hypothetical protein